MIDVEIARFWKLYEPILFWLPVVQESLPVKFFASGGGVEVGMEFLKQIPFRSSGFLCFCLGKAGQIKAILGWYSM
ncbi:hypothetical protein ACFW4K_07695 [Nocardiopsis alba]|uniref:hypothetical protein n=1 Tax=Nocardiopsis alba TaxID=53437 RepID=UPI003671EC64